MFGIFSIAFENEHCTNERKHFRKIHHSFTAVYTCILLLQVDLSSRGSARQAINSLISDAMIPLTASYTDGREKTRK